MVGSKEEKKRKGKETRALPPSSLPADSKPRPGWRLLSPASLIHADVSVFFFRNPIHEAGDSSTGNFTSIISLIWLSGRYSHGQEAQAESSLNPSLPELPPAFSPRVLRRLPSGVFSTAGGSSLYRQATGGRIGVFFHLVATDHSRRRQQAASPSSLLRVHRLVLDEAETWPVKQGGGGPEPGRGLDGGCYQGQAAEVLREIHRWEVGSNESPFSVNREAGNQSEPGVALPSMSPSGPSGQSRAIRPSGHSLPPILPPTPAHPFSLSFPLSPTLSVMSIQAWHKGMPANRCRPSYQHSDP